MRDFENIPGVINGKYQPNGLKKAQINPNWSDEALILKKAEAGNFVKATPEELSGGTILFRVSSRNKKGGAYWFIAKPETIEDLIGKVAVRPEWNSFEEIFMYKVPDDSILKVWKGSAARQSVTDYEPDFYLPGGGEQIYIPPILRNEDFINEIINIGKYD